MENIFYYASVNNIKQGQKIWPYGRERSYQELLKFVLDLSKQHLNNETLKEVFNGYLFQHGIKSYDTTDIFFQVAREAIAEEVREEHFPDRPSRIGSVL